MLTLNLALVRINSANLGFSFKPMVIFLALFLELFSSLFSIMNENFKYHLCSRFNLASRFSCPAESQFPLSEAYI